VADERFQLTYRELHGLALACGEWLRQNKVAGNIGLLLPNGADFFVALLGVDVVPATCVPLNPLLTTPELGRLLSHAQVETVLTVKLLADRLPAAVARVVSLEDIMPTLLARAPRAPAPALLPEPEDIAAVIYTSGTSAEPKGVMLSHRNLTANVTACVQALALDDHYVVLGVLPTSHCFALTVTVLLPLLVGAAAVAVGRFSPAAVLQAAERHRASVLPAVPGIFATLAHARERATYDVSALELCISGGEPLPRTVYDEFQEQFALRLVQGYGLTECSPVVAVNPPADPRPETVGPPLPGLHVEVRGTGTPGAQGVWGRRLPPAVGVTGRQAAARGAEPLWGGEGALPVGGVGEVAVRGESVMVGYYRDPEATREVIDEEGWLHTGDLGRFDERGHLLLCGRKKELIIIGGENVFPGEVEAVLSSHPAVSLSAVVGVKDPLHGEVPKAYVVLNPGMRVTPAELRQFCRTQLAPFKVPREISIRESLPLTPTGKVLKRRLVADG
jgi:long-chain acyl-CoA synthetase